MNFICLHFTFNPSASSSSSFCIATHTTAHTIHYIHFHSFNHFAMIPVFRWCSLHFFFVVFFFPDIPSWSLNIFIFQFADDIRRRYKIQINNNNNSYEKQNVERSRRGLTAGGADYGGWLSRKELSMMGVIFIRGCGGAETYYYFNGNL